jgi:hypothetical protein
LSNIFRQAMTAVLLDMPPSYRLALWSVTSVGVILLAVAAGWCVVWRCIMVKLPAVREVFGLEESVHGSRRRRKSQ